MPERRRRPDLDERFSLYPLEGEDVVAALLGTAHHEDEDDEDDPAEGSDS